MRLRLGVAAVWAWLALSAAGALADDAVFECNEGSTCTIYFTVCDDSYDADNPIPDSTNCPKGGSKVTYTDISSFRVRLDNRACRYNFELYPTTAVTVTSNPVRVRIPAASINFVGRCSNAASTCCDADADCGSGNTCDKPKEPEGQGRQVVIATVEAVYSGGTLPDRIPGVIKNLEFYPFP